MEHFPEKHPIIAIVIIAAFVNLVLLVPLSALLAPLLSDAAVFEDMVTAITGLLTALLCAPILYRVLRAEIKAHPGFSLKAALYGFVSVTLALSAIMAIVRILRFFLQPSL